ncbi:rho-gtpase-activating 6 [Fusarium heterosporum]|uniref:Rho-gtpase-activating 6 n=1 Tax=Fusarium heterosporum TaxID=42747 RepID=A0A8H5WS60_FUSHE|nr:rho-gtpase-activating 6 [Fusarium heterosporum]
MDQHYHPALGHYSAPENLQYRLPSRSSLSLQATIRQITDQGPVHTSKTWTTSSGDHNILNDTDELEDRAGFVQEYNRLAKKGKGLGSPRKQGWLHRILRSSSNQADSGNPTTHQAPRHKRSVSDLAHSLIHRRETPKVLDIQSMVRISGKSMFYLPTEHAPSALILPTCLRATAHHIAQHVTTRGIFRIPGSFRVVNTLFDYYCCTEQGNADITSTVRCANLPMHVQASVHDVASTFKRLLSVIPGGILGSLSLFDAFVAIHSQLRGDPEFPRTKHTKVRARLIALAIATVESQFRRELICAVFGLLSLIGRVAEITPREDEAGRSLPTGDLMGYTALGIVFGPLLLGDMLGLYSMKLATPKSGLLVLPLRSPKSRQDRHVRKTLQSELPSPPTVDKVLIANSITEMLIVNWRDVVRQMKSLGMNRQHGPRSVSPQTDSQENGFVIRKPQGWDREWRKGERGYETQRESSPEPSTPTLGVSKQELRRRGSSTSKKLGIRPSIGFLSPTVEESTPDEDSHGNQNLARKWSNQSYGHDYNDPGMSNMRHSENIDTSSKAGHTQNGSIGYADPIISAKARGSFDNPRVSEEHVPLRTSSKRKTRITPSYQVSPEVTSQETSTIPIAAESTPSKRKGAIRKKHPGKDELPTSRPVVFEWPEPQSRSNEIMGKPEFQSTEVQFPSEKEALEAALKAHFEELRELDNSHQQGISCEADIKETDRRFEGHRISQQGTDMSERLHSGRVMSLSVEPKNDESLLDGSSPWFSIPRRTPKTLIRPSLSPTDKQAGVRAMTAKFESSKFSTTPVRARSTSKTQNLISHFSQESPVKSVHSTRSVSTLAHSKREESISSQNPVQSHNISTGEDALTGEAHARSLRVSVGEEAAIKAVEIQQTDKERRQSRASHNQAGMLTQRQVVPPRKPIPNGRTKEASLENLRRLGTMMPYPEQPPIAQYLNFVRPLSSTSNGHGGSDYLVPHNTPALTSRPGSTTILHTQIRSLQRQLDLKIEETLQLKRQLEVQEDADVGTLSQQLREAKREAQMWRERAESAERRIKVFERFTSRLSGIRAASSLNEGDIARDGLISPEHATKNANRQEDKLENIAGCESDSSEKTEDAGLVSDRIRKCLDGLTDGPPDMPPFEIDQDQCTSQNQKTERNTSPNAVEVWMTAQELLQLSESQGQKSQGATIESDV